MNFYPFLTTLLEILVAFTGAVIGSFLNVVIYRVPRNLSVNEPRRSFCPSCKKGIPWYNNIPLVSWLMLRGKCADCGARISVRYFLVELLVAGLFYLIFKKSGGPWPLWPQWGPQVLAMWVFFSLLVAGTFIDIEHFILPHSLTICCVPVGMAFAFWAPQLVEQQTHSQGLLISFLSAFLGLGILWSVVELGKICFGRLNVKFDKPESWSISEKHPEQPPVLTLDGEDTAWEDLFARSSDRLLLHCPELKMDERRWTNVVAEVKAETVRVKTNAKSKEGELIQLADIKEMSGTTTHVTIPREAMGFGDVLLIAMIGSFCGWKAVLFTIFAGSVIGSIFAVVPRLFGKTEWTAKIPFGPYLAAGAGLWVFYGHAFLQWYLSVLNLRGGAID
jgi:leader peptidase (prepilin peptidase)/N-methyltransferase